MPVGAFTTMNGLSPCQMLHLGDTDKTQSELEAYLGTINHQYTQQTYDLINNNCNNFSNTVALFLLNTGIPSHIVDLPRIVFSTPGGMMLRPMIESMQNGISQSGGGLDPFGGGSGGTNPLQTLSNINTSSYGGNTTTTSATTVSSVPSPSSSSSEPAKVVTTTTVRTFTPTHEEKPFVSADVDAKTLKALYDKILKYKSTDANVEKTLWSDDESSDLSECINGLSAASLSYFPHKTFALLGRLIETVKPLHLASLFILRLLALQVPKCDASECSRGNSAYAACQHTAHLLLRLVRAADENSRISLSVSLSPASLVMAVCTLANLVSSKDGCDLLFSHDGSIEGQNDAASRVGMCIDACSWGLSHEKAEVRQMSATLAYNLALASTKRFSMQSIVITQDISLPSWQSLHVTNSDEVDRKFEHDEEQEELHQHIVQILCAVLETVGDETDSVSLGRKLHAAYYVCAAGGAPASELVAALGFDEHLQRVREEKLHLLNETDKHRLGNFELLLQGTRS